MEDIYIVSAEEILWGTALVAATMACHGFGMVLTLYASRSFAARFAGARPALVGLSALILASWMVALVHCGDVALWAGFFLYWTGGMPNASTAYYYALLEYTTLGSDLGLPRDWRLLEGLIAVAGFLTFAWSTGVLLTLVQDFQNQQVLALERRRDRRQRTPPTPRASPDDRNAHA